MEFTKAWFDQSIKAWLENKNKKANGQYFYRCEYKYSDSRHCSNDVFKTLKFCKEHFNKK